MYKNIICDIYFLDIIFSKTNNNFIDYFKFEKNIFENPL